MCNQISFLSPDGLCAFTAFLVSEFSEENIAFYFACEDYRNTKSPAKLPAKAQKIFDEFIGSEAPREVIACTALCLSQSFIDCVFATNFNCAGDNFHVSVSALSLLD